MTFWFDGQLNSADTLALSITEPAFLYGATIFTTLRVYGQSLDHPSTDWLAHCDRIRTSLTTLNWPSPNWKRVRAGAEALLPHYPVLRITLLPDGRELMTGRALPPDLATDQQAGRTAWVAHGPQYHRYLPQHKTGNYLGGWLALQAAQQQGAGEAILINPQGHWLETSTGNLWGWCEGRWWTPPLAAGLLPGVVRSRLMTHLQTQGHPAIEAPWTSAQIQRFETLAYTNSVVEVIPLHTVLDGQIRLEYRPNQAAVGLLRQAFASPD